MAANILDHIINKGLTDKTHIPEFPYITLSPQSTYLFGRGSPPNHGLIKNDTTC